MSGGGAGRTAPGGGSLAQVREVAARHGLRLRRAWPRGPEHLLLDLVPAHGCGPAVAGQWLAPAVRAAEVARSTGGGASADGPVVLQPAGADRRLPALAPLAARPGARLAAHRPERRGVVGDADGTWTKVVRPGRSRAVEAAARAAAVPGVRVPEVLAADHARGTVTTAALPGRALHDLLGDPGVPAVAVEAACRATGAALAALHAAPLPEGAVAHGAAAELAVLEGWLAAAREHGALAGSPGTGAVREALAAGRPGPPVRLHRDLHDKQVLVDGEGAVGVLDFDLAAAGEAALDLANLLEHLALRAAQGRCSPALAAACRAAVLDGYRPDPGVLARLDAYAAATRLRLLAVYAFRPGQEAAAAALLRPR
ncbi:phosphotransferase [Vallicoccus soli]|uniref:Aminoglycoside phosphotransferase domain-containing protein n=1 Tax=Vallicoccus soli TaxID=2339232 RepID=A0A3A3YV67_9ACTN|nr:phosphotransferase [Vallicoccus soli]RJK93754.1 hypothetical protein D5H78_15570 [Vallicoccus soli]